MDWAVGVPVAVALVAPVATYIVAARRMSGKIATSDASDLWAESKSIRDDYRTQLQQANDRVLSLEGRMAKAEAHEAELLHENFELRRRVAELEGLVKEQATTIHSLETQLAEVNGR